MYIAKKGKFLKEEEARIQQLEELKEKCKALLIENREGQMDIDAVCRRCMCRRMWCFDGDNATKPMGTGRGHVAPLLLPIMPGPEVPGSSPKSGIRGNTPSQAIGHSLPLFRGGGRI